MSGTGRKHRVRRKGKCECGFKTRDIKKLGVHTMVYGHKSKENPS